MSSGEQQDSSKGAAQTTTKERTEAMANPASSDVGTKATKPAGSVTTAESPVRVTQEAGAPKPPAPAADNGARSTASPKTSGGTPAGTPKTTPNTAAATASSAATPPQRAANSAPTPTRSTANAGSNVGAQRVRLTISRVDPFSVLKLSFLLAVGLGIASIIASIVLWGILNAMGVFSSLNDTLGADGKFTIYEYVSLGKVLAFTTIAAVANLVIITALCTLSAYLYNMAASLVGGAEVDLSNE